MPTRKTESLLAYLALHPVAGGHGREKLAALFWGDTSDEDARRSLRVTLSALRKALSENCLLTDRETVQINPAWPLWVDAAEVADRATRELDGTQGEPEDLCTELYRDDLLPGFSDGWVEPERARIRDLHLRAMLHAAQRRDARGDHNAMLALARRVLQLDPAEEQAHRLIIVHYFQTGDRGSALRQYEVCLAALGELGVKPAAETLTLYQALKTAASEPLFAPQPSNLPVPLTSFVGRQAELATVKTLLSAARLVTLTGAGGSGKTRLAIEAAAGLLEAYEGGVWWVDLAPLTDGALVARMVARAVGAQDAPQRSPTAAITERLSGQSALLVLDNCEHLAQACAQLVSELLAACPGLRVLATSRGEPGRAGRTGLAGADALASWRRDTAERRGVPKLRGDQALRGARGFAAARISARPPERGRHRRHLPAAGRHAPGHRAGRLPHPRALPRPDRPTAGSSLRAADRRQPHGPAAPTDVAGRGGLELRSVGRSGAPPLAPAGRLCRRLEPGRCGACLRRCPGARDAQAAIGAETVLDLLGRLVDKSLVLAAETGGEARFSFLETIREYAAARLAEAGETETYRARHAAFFAELSEEGYRELHGAGQLAWLDRLDADHDNLRAALTWLLTAPVEIAPRRMALRMAGALARFWDQRDHFAEGQQWLEQILAAMPDCAPSIEAPASDFARALYGAGTMAWRQGEYGRAYEYHARSAACYQAAGDQVGLARAWQSMAVQLNMQGDRLRGDALLAESIALARRCGAEWELATGLASVAWMALSMGDLPRAVAAAGESTAIYRRLGSEVNLYVPLSVLVDVEILRGNYERARESLDEALALARACRNARFLADALQSQGACCAGRASSPHR